MLSSVFNLRLNTGCDGDDETKGGKLFQTRAAATEDARSPVVECFNCRHRIKYVRWREKNLNQTATRCRTSVQN